MQETDGRTVIEITCDVQDMLALADMTEFQGGLKVRTAEDYDRIFFSIAKYGIAFPFFVWKNGDVSFILDGHGRVEALRRAESNGISVPPLPVVYVEAGDENAAKNLLLRLNSRYGTITRDGVMAFVEGSDIDLEEANIPELPDLSARLDALLDDMPEHDYLDKVEFTLYCPECGERHDVTDDELREVVGYEG